MRSVKGKIKGGKIDCELIKFFSCLDGGGGSRVNPTKFGNHIVGDVVKDYVSGITS